MAETLRLEDLPLDPVGDDFCAVTAGHELTVSRGRFLRTKLIAGAGLLLAGAAVPPTADASAAATPRQDARILQFLLRLEYLQADFYAAALDAGRLSGELREFAEVVGAHEREHVALLEERLRSSTGTKPTFDFGDATRDANRFAGAARAIEETGVAAYIGQGANLTPQAVVAVSRITSVEARHAAWIADFLGHNPAPRAADKATSAKTALAEIRRLGFLK